MNYPSEYLSQMQDLLGADYPLLLDALGKPARAALRLNPLRPGTEALLGPAVTGTVPWEPRGRYVADGFRPGADPAHFAGGYYMQDASAMAPARVLDAAPGELVLDLCAAPGGKSGQIAAMLGHTGALVANEPDPKRAQALWGNLERLGAANSAVLCALPHQLPSRFAQIFDAVLVDAPCSGEGMFRRDPDARAQWSPGRVRGCAQRQRDILAHAARMVRPGGRLVYSTCTFNRAENEDNVAWLVDTHPDFVPGDFALNGVGPSRDGCLRLWPHQVEGEGHFVALLRRKGRAEPRTAAPTQSSREAGQAFAMLQALLPGDWLAPFAHWPLRLQGDLVLALPPLLPDLAGLKALSSGLRLCRVGRGYVKPEHALAMAAHTQALPRQDLTQGQAARFLRGEAIETSRQGWTVATWHGLPLGWGKGTEGALKNHLPKGLRLA